MLKELREIFNLSDIIVAALMIIIISLMVIPIPTSALDVLMVINLAISLMVLLVSMYLQQPLDFASFPLSSINCYPISIID